MGHHHGHGHDHSHDLEGINERRLLIAFGLTAAFMLAEVAGGLISGSLALLADAAHMLIDAAALGLAWGASRISQRPADEKRSFGYQRFQVIAALINGLALMAAVVFIVGEAIERIEDPVQVEAGLMGAVAATGFAINLLVFFVIRKGSKDNINMQGALLHVLVDIGGSIAAVIAAIAISTTGFTIIDPILSLILGFIVLSAAWGLVKKATHILMEGAPDHIDRDDLRDELVARFPSVEDAHHIHIWQLTTSRTLLTMHVNFDSIDGYEATLEDIKKWLVETHGIHHSTIQAEFTRCADGGHKH